MGTPSDEGVRHRQSRIENPRRRGGDQCSKGDAGDRRVSRYPSHPGKPLERAVPGWRLRVSQARKEDLDRSQSQAKKGDLFQQICKLQLEVGWLNKISAALTMVDQPKLCDRR